MCCQHATAVGMVRERSGLSSCGGRGQEGRDVSCQRALQASRRQLRQTRKGMLKGNSHAGSWSRGFRN